MLSCQGVTPIALCTLHLLQVRTSRAKQLAIRRSSYKNKFPLMCRSQWPKTAPWEGAFTESSLLAQYHSTAWLTTSTISQSDYYDTGGGASSGQTYNRVYRGRSNDSSTNTVDLIHLNLFTAESVHHRINCSIECRYGSFASTWMKRPINRHLTTLLLILDSRLTQSFLSTQSLSDAMERSIQLWRLQRFQLWRPQATCISFIVPTEPAKYSQWAQHQNG